MRTWDIVQWRRNPETPTIIGKCYLLAMPAWRTTLREHLHILASDLRRGARVVTKAPGFAFAALLAIVLGVASTAVVFSGFRVKLRDDASGDQPESWRHT